MLSFKYGSVGKGGLNPGKSIHQGFYRYYEAHCQGTIKWTTDPDWGYQVPLEIPEIDLTEYNPAAYFSEDEYQKRVAGLRQERIRWLNKYPGLKEEIVRTILEPVKTL